MLSHLQEAAASQVDSRPISISTCNLGYETPRLHSLAYLSRHLIKEASTKSTFFGGLNLLNSSANSFASACISTSMK